jgi:hypothetical protein
MLDGFGERIAFQHSSDAKPQRNIITGCDRGSESGPANSRTVVTMTIN